MSKLEDHGTEENKNRIKKKTDKQLAGMLSRRAHRLRGQQYPGLMTDYFVFLEASERLKGKG